MFAALYSGKFAEVAWDRGANYGTDAVEVTIKGNFWTYVKGALKEGFMCCIGMAKNSIRIEHHLIVLQTVI